MIRVFIGFDQREAVAFHVAVASIMRHASEPVAITPLARQNLRLEFRRPRGPLDSTDFAISRFLVPHLCGFEGRAIFIDCDMLLRTDIAQLWHHVQAEPSLRQRAVCVVQHDYVPRTARKFLGQQVSAINRVIKDKTHQAVRGASSGKAAAGDNNPTNFVRHILPMTQVEDADLLGLQFPHAALLAVLLPGVHLDATDEGHGIAALRALPLKALAAQVATNFTHLFAPESPH